MGWSSGICVVIWYLTGAVGCTILPPGHPNRSSTISHSVHQCQTNAIPKDCLYLTLLWPENPCFHYCFPRIKFALSHVEWKFLVIWPQTTFLTSSSLPSWTALWIYFPNNSTLEPLFFFFFFEKCGRRNARDWPQKNSGEQRKPLCDIG